MLLIQGKHTKYKFKTFFLNVDCSTVAHYNKTYLEHFKNLTNKLECLILINTSTLV
jgi:hypothetical protein